MLEAERVRALTERPLLEPPPRTPLQTLTAWWTPRRTVVMAALWPTLLLPLWLRAADAQPPGLVLLISFGAALSLTSCTPARGQTLGQVLGSPCASVGGLVPVLCAVSLIAQPGGNPWLALFLIGFGLSQRFASPGACGVPPRKP